MLGHFGVHLNTQAVVTVRDVVSEVQRADANRPTEDKIISCISTAHILDTLGCR